MVPRLETINENNVSKLHTFTSRRKLKKKVNFQSAQADKSNSKNESEIDHF